jgi:adenosine deaminase
VAVVDVEPNPTADQLEAVHVARPAESPELPDAVVEAADPDHPIAPQPDLVQAPQPLGRGNDPLPESIRAHVAAAGQRPPMSNQSLRATDFLALPKAELHLHTEAAIRPATAAEFADRSGLPLPPIGQRHRTWPTFSTAYERCRALIGSLDDLRRVVREVFEHAPAQGIVWTELHVVPHLYAGRLGPVEGLVEAAVDGIELARRAGGGEGGLVLGVGRDASACVADEVTDLALTWAGRGVVAMGLTGKEDGFPSSRFAAAYRRARDSGLGVVPHSGESGDASCVAETLRELQPHRISHGVRAAEDDAVLAELAQQQICLDVALTGNLQLCVVPSARDHPLPELIRRGIPVSLGSDAPYLYGVDLLDEYALAHQAFGLPASAMASIAADSLRHARSDVDLLHRHGAAIDRWMNATSID